MKEEGERGRRLRWRGDGEGKGKGGQDGMYSR